MKRSTIEEMTRDELVEWLEGARGFGCYDSEPVDALREAALLDYDDCHEEDGF